MSKSGKKTRMVLFIVYSALVLWLTIGTRGIGSRDTRMDLFWSYKEWFSGNWTIGWQILCNIALFIPFGLLCPRHKRFLFLSILLSLVIELLQLFTFHGLFEFDDIMNNTIGVVIGWAAGRRIADKWKTWMGVASVAFVSICILITPTSVPNIPNILCFQVENDGCGFCFRIDKPLPYTIKIRDATGKTREIKAQTGIERPEVAEYFGEEYRYSGFRMKLPSDNGEIIIYYNPLLTIPTGVFVSESELRYTREKNNSSPTITVPFVTEGKLLVCRPDFHCWVYQYEGSLYWIADQDFCFEDDGTTYVQYHLWTTQTEKLPQHRLENKWLWDNIGGYFEDYEIQGNFGEYRVMKRELPTVYPIVSILTGYYKDGKWIWKEYFRPYYDFE